ncbi:MAG: GNAT family N-acetyltransferase [Bacteroidetes bacterium]|nr:GNAT family N-acetyltransferase [Bacteroidota bacterium]
MWQDVSPASFNKTIRLGVSTDLSALITMYNRVTDHLFKQGLKQWHNDYPGEKALRKDLNQSSLFLYEINSQIVGSVVLDTQQDPQYKDIAWQYESEKVLVIHRLAVDPAFSGRGIAQSLCKLCEQVGQEAGFEVIRLDAFRANDRSNIFYQKMGYRKTKGYCQFDYQDLPCDCYEKWIGG